MEHLIARVDALEHHLRTLEAHTRAVEQRLRWWRRLAWGLLVFSVVSLGQAASTAQEEPAAEGRRRLAQHVAALEQLLTHFSREGNELFITGANLHLVNGLGSTDCGPEDTPIPHCPNGLGNLIVGYNELRTAGEFAGANTRAGSHNVVVGSKHNFSRFGGLVVGVRNEISGDFASVSGGVDNTASGDFASVSGGDQNTASGDFASVSGGSNNAASGLDASVSGGTGNTASGFFASVSGGLFNAASGGVAAVSGGSGNTASGFFASVSGGLFNAASGFETTVSGGVLNTASGDATTVSGGHNNTAAGRLSTVSGGVNRTAEGEFDWVAGSLFEDE